MSAAQVVFFGLLGILLIIVGVGIGRYSVDDPVSVLPTRLPATPINYEEILRATRAPYGFSDGTATSLPATVTGHTRAGRVLYDTHCAHCHGYAGEGEPGGPNPNLPDALGYMPVPRHDSQGRTWLYPDQLLIEVIKVGTTNPINRFQMPAFAGILNDAQINIILDYIKAWWTPAQREQQAAVTERFRVTTGR